MTKKLIHSLTNQTQIIVSACELKRYSMALQAIARIRLLLDEMEKKCRMDQSRETDEEKAKDL